VSRKGLLPAVGLLAIAIVAALAVVLVSSFASGGEQSATSPLAPDIDPGSARPPGGGLRADGIAAQGTLDPRITLFGDTIVAHVDVLLDRQRVDPASVRVGTEFLPWEIVGQPTRVRRDSGTDTHLRTTFALRCTGSPCIPPNQSAALEFDAARISYAKPGAAPGDRTSIPVHWPVLLVYSRFAAANADGSTETAGQNPWRADFISFPAATYRISPSLLLPVLIVLAGLLAVAGFVLAFVAIPRRRREPAPEPEPEPEPVIVLTPLEQALELLEDASRADGTEDRRRALELVAEVLDLDHPELARAARTLAWSEDDPRVEQTSGLATRVRTTIDTNGNGRGP
jgi:hypothetical protein